MKSISLFLATFVVGALLALAARTARHDPHAGHDTTGATTTRGDYAPMVHNSPPASAAAPSAHSSHPAPAARDPHAGHAAAKTPVNTVCAICGMKVDPSLPTMEYQGQTIGFGCKMCAPKFKAEPDKYGPSYLRNELIKR
jgi:YHS domain-containing protein